MIAGIYNENLKDISGVRLTLPPENIYHSYYKYYFFIKPENFSISRDKIIEKINDKNIFCQVGSCSEIYKEIALQHYKPEKQLINTQKLFETALLLKCDPTITKENALKNIKDIKSILKTYVK